MSQITDENLYERGFLEGRNYFEKTIRGVTITVEGELRKVYIDLHPLPNCKTLEDLDSLIKLLS